MDNNKSYLERKRAREFLTSSLPRTTTTTTARPTRQRRGGLQNRSRANRNAAENNNNSYSPKNHESFDIKTARVIPASSSQVVTVKFEKATATKVSSPVIERNHPDFVIPGEEEFNQTYNSVRKSSLSSNENTKLEKQSLVAAFSKNTSSESHEQHFQNVTNHDANIERTSGAINNIPPAATGEIFPEAKNQRNNYGGNVEGINNDSGQPLHSQTRQRSRNNKDNSMTSRTNPKNSAFDSLSPKGSTFENDRFRKKPDPPSAIDRLSSSNVSPKNKEKLAEVSPYTDLRSTNHKVSDEEIASLNNKTRIKLDSRDEVFLEENSRLKDRNNASLVSRPGNNTRISNSVTKQRQSVVTSPAKKRSQYLPMYIQPVKDDTPSRFPSHKVYSDYGLNRNLPSDIMYSHTSSTDSLLSKSSISSQRKISTDMNKYDSSSSSSSESSSENEQGNLRTKKQNTHKLINAFEYSIKTKVRAESPPSSDDGSSIATNRRPRNRRMRRSRAQNQSFKRNAVIDEQPKSSTINDRFGNPYSNDDKDNNLFFADKYATVPDNFVTTSHSNLSPAVSSVGQSKVTSKRINTPSRNLHLQDSNEQAFLNTSSSNNETKHGDIKNSGDQLIISNRQGLLAQNKVVEKDNTYNKQIHSPLNIDTTGGRLYLESSTTNSTATDITLLDELKYVHDQNKSSPKVYKPSQTEYKKKALGDIRNIFDNQRGPSGDLGQSYLPKDHQEFNDTISEIPTGKSTQSHKPLYNAKIVQHSFENVVQSQPKLKARKVSEHFWPRDEATEKLLNQRHSEKSSPQSNSDKMQETIDQLQGLADDKAVTLHSKLAYENDNGVNSSTLTSKSNSQSLSANDLTYIDTGQSHSIKRPGILNISKVQMVRIPTLDIFPDSSNKDGIKTDYYENQDRAKSVENLISQKDNSTFSNSRKYNQQTQNKSQSHMKVQPNSVPNDDISRTLPDIYSKFQSRSSHPKSTIVQMKELTASLRKFNKLAGPPKPLKNTSLQLQKAVANTDPLLCVSKTGNVTKELLDKKTVDSPALSEASLEIDEGIVTEPVLSPIDHEKNVSKFAARLNADKAKLAARRRRKGSSNNNSDLSGGSNGSDALRSRSDPSADRGKIPENENVTMDSNLLTPLQTQFQHESKDHLSSMSVGSDRISIGGDYTDSQDIINEPTLMNKALEEAEGVRKNSKKKSYSDPNPKGVISGGFNGDGEVIDEAAVCSANSEPNIAEQCDQLGDLDQFRKYQSSKALSDGSIKVQESKSPNANSKLSQSKHIEKSNAADKAMSPKTLRKAVSLKARKRAENDVNKNLQNRSKSEESIYLNKQNNIEILENEEQQFNKIYESMRLEANKRHPITYNKLSEETRNKVEKYILQQSNMKNNRNSGASIQSYDSDKHSKDSDSNEMGYNLNNHIPDDQVNHIIHARSSSEPVAMSDETLAKVGNYILQQNEVRSRRIGVSQTPTFDSADPIDITTSDVNLHGLSDDLHTQELTTAKSVDRVYATLPRAAKPLYLDADGKRPDMRLLVLNNLMETEESYVNSLQVLYESYYKPLKEAPVICEPRLVDEMFYQIPQILEHHESFSDNLRNAVHNWHQQDIKLGELFMNSFNRDMLLESYSAYINNFLNAKEAVRVAIQSKAGFKTFIEQCQRENKEKQGLSDLMIKPVQRIPRYELILKDLIKHTPDDHPDRPSLLLAQQEIHTLAEQMNRGEKEAEAAEKHARILQDIEALIDNCIDLCVPKRRFLRQDIAVELKNGTKKDRSIWLFNDLIVCTTVKKGRTGTLRRSSVNIWGMERLNIDFTNKYKFMWKFPLEDIELVTAGGPSRQVVDKQVHDLQADIEILQKIDKLTNELTSNHQQLNDSLKDLIAMANTQLAEKQKYIPHSGSSPRVELAISTPGEMKHIVFEFPPEDRENKVQFETLFNKYKSCLTLQHNLWEPVFMKAIPITKTRSGMQFSCATPNIDVASDIRVVWVCNSDGFVGQVCLLNLDNGEPTQTKCISVCKSKICCIAEVPAFGRKLVPTSALLKEISKAPILSHDRRNSSCTSTGNPAMEIIAWDDTDDDDEDNTSSVSTNSNHSHYSHSHPDSPSNTNNSNIGGRRNRKHKSLVQKRSLPVECHMSSTKDDDLSQPAVLSPLITSALISRRFGFTASDKLQALQSQHYDTNGNTGDTDKLRNTLPDTRGLHDGGAWKKDSDGSTLHGSLDDLLSTDEILKPVPENAQFVSGKGSMWLGTEDGQIHIYPSANTIRSSQNCVRAVHSAAINCILYYESQVFVALSNGDLVSYSRNMDGEWDFEGKQISLGTAQHAISKMVVVDAKQKELWCGCQNQIIIVDIARYTVVKSFSVSDDNKRQVHCIVCCGYGVWVALDKRPHIKLYHALTQALLTDFDVAAPVNKMLASSDAIIRQHKSACLRITALLVCKELLWVGTSAGVVLTLKLPKVRAGTTSLTLPIMPLGLAYGHTGHVRFLTAVEIPDEKQSTSGVRRSSSLNKRRSSVSSSSSGQTLIISGGDGYEDFRINSTAESAGKEDSTNHLLIWKA